MQYGGCVCVYFHKCLCQQKPVAPTPTEKKFNLAEGKLIKKFRPIFTKIFYLIHPTRQLLFFLFVNTLGEKYHFCLELLSSCATLKNLAYSPVSTSGMGGCSSTDWFFIFFFWLLLHFKWSCAKARLVNKKFAHYQSLTDKCCQLQDASFQAQPVCMLAAGVSFSNTETLLRFQRKCKYGALGKNSNLQAAYC